MDSFDYFCDFAWGHIDDVYEIDESIGIPKYSPYVEFVLGCALVALADHSPRKQKEYFGFTLKELVDNDHPSCDFGARFYDKYSRRNIRSASISKDGSAPSILPCGCSPEAPEATCSCERKPYSI